MDGTHPASVSIGVPISNTVNLGIARECLPPTGAGVRNHYGRCSESFATIGSSDLSATKKNEKLQRLKGKSTAFKRSLPENPANLGLQVNLSSKRLHLAGAKTQILRF